MAKPNFMQLLNRGSRDDARSENLCICVGGGEQKSVGHNLIPLHPVDIVLALLSKSGGGGGAPP